MRKFRDRLIEAYGVSRASAVPMTKSNPRMLFILGNKRYTSQDVDVLYKAAAILRTRFNWTNIKSVKWQGFRSFRRQLQVVLDTDIYLSAPGSSLLNAPFLPDGAVVINVGSWV